MRTSNLAICSFTRLQTESTTVRLFDHSIWINMNHGRFMNRRTKEERTIIQLYPKIRTAVRPGGVIFAKRKNSESDLFLVPLFRARRLL